MPGRRQRLDRPQHRRQAAPPTGSSASTTPQGGAAAGTTVANPVSTTTAQAAGKKVSDCTLVTAAQLTAAVGVKYTSIQPISKIWPLGRLVRARHQQLAKRLSRAERADYGSRGP